MAETAGSVPVTLDTLYNESSSSSSPQKQYEPIRLTAAESFSTLEIPLAKKIFGHGIQEGEEDLVRVKNSELSYTDFVSTRVKRLAESETISQKLRSQLLHIGLAALFSFLQSNVTGPPLAFDPAKVIFPTALAETKAGLNAIRRKIIRDLSVDGEAAYQLTPNVELFCVAKSLLVDSGVLVTTSAPLAARVGRMRVNFLHQKMLSEVTGTLQDLIYVDLDEIAKVLLDESNSAAEEKARFLVERATIHTYYGFDAKARVDLEQAATTRKFEFALTGKLGKRTKFQDRDISQLVVLAKSADDKATEESTAATEKDNAGPSAPQNIDLNDDTLLESISFSKEDEKTQEKSMTVQDTSSLPSSLASIDPAKQPMLKPIDSAILLALASAITNTTPENGLTREETLPYATRVLEGGSSNWQIYTQALLVRSRIEGFRARTVERGVLQMQALVDQVIADTASVDSAPVDTASPEAATTFLPRPEKSESAPAVDRLEYIWLLNFTTRWGLEAELANRWVNIGGLRTALDIYERLQMWAEVALCYAATEREDKAEIIVRRQLYERTNKDVEDENDRFEGSELSPLPADAPRLFCILGDINKAPSMYERAWDVSNHRYARAQRSLARHYLSAKPPALDKAEEAYRKSLQINRLNHGAWFALGCVQLELQKWEDAIQAFTRVVQLEETDAEAWSNLAAALLHVSSSEPAQIAADDITSNTEKNAEDEEGEAAPITKDPYKNKRDALAALHRAAQIKHDDYRIWDNLLTVAVSIPPPDIPFKDIILAERRVIEIQGPKKGEKCIDLSILTMLVDYVVKNYEYDDLLIAINENGTERVLRRGTIPGQIITLVDENVVPLITHSAPLWLLVARLEQFRHRPSKAFEAHEKAWRAVVASSTQGAFQMGDEKKWTDVVKATERLVREGYAKFGGMEKEGQEEGKTDAETELVAKDWRFKARSAVRGILGKGKEFWEGTEGWDRLKELQSEVSGSS